ncbi:MAG: OprO/OprP family phosphate-selective porin [Planctomycetaceae bacterium]|jgi:phosphate-selective porin OprO/OprP|nr:OprO/OprP family phosphate-selective porin [Planctomycetaceae bacterium]
MMINKLNRHLFTILSIVSSLLVGYSVTVAETVSGIPPTSTAFAPYESAQNLPVYANDASLESRIIALESALKKKQDKPDSKKGFTRVIDGRVYFDSYNVMKQDGSSTAGPASLKSLSNYNGLRDLRIGVKGEGYEIFDYKVDLCFIEQTGSNSGTYDGGITDKSSFNNAAVNLKDVWFGVKNVPLLEYVRIGHYRLEDGISVLTGGTNTTFFEFDGRDFATGRRIGISSRHLWARDTIRFFAGFFYDRDIATRNRFDRNEDQGSITNFRLTFLPYASRDKNGKIDGKKLLFFGANYSYYDLSKAANGSQSASFTERFGGLNLNALQSFTIPTDNYNKFGLEFAYQNTAFTLQSEAYANVYNLVTINKKAKDRTIWGAYVTAKYFLTGDYRKFSADTAAWSGVNLKHNLDLKKVNDLNRADWIGGLELAVKWAYTDTSSLAGLNNSYFTGSSQDITVGLNWYWSPNARWLFDYVHVIPSQQRNAKTRDHSNTDIFAASFRYNF